MNLVECVVATGRFGPDALEVKSWLYFGLAAATTAACLAFFNHMQQKITAGSTPELLGVPVDLTIFDVRFGYTPRDVGLTLEAWGDAGRYHYLLIEAVDVFIYHSGYRAACLVLLNHLLSALVARFPVAAPVRPLAQLPIVLAILDFFEDLLQITFTYFFDFFGHVQAPDTPAWYRIVYAASAVNQIKWCTVRGGGVTALVAVVALAGGYVWDLVVGGKQRRGVEATKKED